MDSPSAVASFAVSPGNGDSGPEATTAVGVMFPTPSAASCSILRSGAPRLTAAAGAGAKAEATDAKSIIKVGTYAAHTHSSTYTDNGE